MPRTILVVLTVLLSASVAGLAGCRAEPTEAPTAAPEPTTAAEAPTTAPTTAPTDEPAGPGVTDTSVRSITYTLPDGGAYDLVDGVYREPAAPGSASFNLVALSGLPPAFGDLNGDGVQDASVILINDPGGSGTFRYLAAVVDEDGWPVNTATTSLGDRTRVLSNQVDAGRIVLQVIAHGPEDPMCCPSELHRWTYELQDGALVRTTDELIGPAPTEEAAALPGPSLTLTPDPRKATTGEKVDFYVHATAHEAGIVRLELYQGEERIDEWDSAEAEGEPFVHHTFVWREAEKGAFDFRVKAFDAAGGEGWSPTERVTVKDPAERTEEAESAQP